MKVGIQLYSVRDEMAKDPVETIKKVAQIGYKNLEVANSRADSDPGVGFGVSAEDIIEILKECDARIISGHIRPFNPETADAIIAYHKKIGNTNIGQSIEFYESYEDLLKKCEYYNQMGKICADKGMRFVFHNHYHEFQKIGGKYIYYIIAENTDPKYVDFELDTFWSMRGGADPIEIMDTLGSRITMIHQKDFSKNAPSKINLLSDDTGVLIDHTTFGKGSNPTDFCEIGTGIMDIQKIIDKANSIGVKYIILEQDHSQLGQLESIKVSMDNFKKFKGIEW
jgi:sugar phosphate isomerase/epimerase